MILWGAVNNLVKGVATFFHIGASEDVILSADCYISVITPINSEGVGVVTALSDSIGVTTKINGDVVSLSTPICEC